MCPCTPHNADVIQPLCISHASFAAPCTPDAAHRTASPCAGPMHVPCHSLCGPNPEHMHPVCSPHAPPCTPHAHPTHPHVPPCTPCRCIYPHVCTLMHAPSCTPMPPHNPHGIDGPKVDQSASSIMSTCHMRPGRKGYRHQADPLGMHPFILTGTKPTLWACIPSSSQAPSRPSSQCFVRFVSIISTVVLS